jgi:hypothetical protein
MHITASELQLAASREYRLLEQREERLDLRIGRSALAPQPRSEVELSERGRALALQLGAGESPLLAPEEVAASDESDARNDPSLSLLIRLIETLTGRPVQLFDASELQAPAVEATAAAPSAAAQPPGRANAGDDDPGFSLDYRLRHSRSEYERTVVHAEGEIQTSDGERIRFRLALEMQRSYSESSEFRLQAGAAAQRKDPLVINFDGRAVQLSDQRFEFDLDADGHSESLPLLRGGSGLLAFDRNGDGRINDGRELFGALSGDGFADLAELDSDGNGWLDSADAVFEQLQVWMPQTGVAGDAGRLISLAEAGVAAISLRSIQSSFDLRGNGNSDLGQIRSTGVYLSTAREVGTVQQIDLSV